MNSVQYLYSRESDTLTHSNSTMKDPLATEDVKPVVACRGCLATEQSLRPFDYKLASAYASLIPTDPEFNKQQQFICTYCRALLFKFSLFREKCLAAQKALSVASEAGIPIAYVVLNVSSPLQKLDIPPINIQPTRLIRPLQKVDMLPINMQPSFPKKAVDDRSNLQIEVMEPISLIPSVVVIENQIIKEPTEEKYSNSSEFEFEENMSFNDHDYCDNLSEYLTGELLENKSKLDVTDESLRIKTETNLDKIMNNSLQEKMPDVKEINVPMSTKPVNVLGMKSMIIELNNSRLQIQEITNWKDTSKPQENKAIQNKVKKRGRPRSIIPPNDSFRELQKLKWMEDIDNQLKLMNIKKVAISKEEQKQEILKRKESLNYQQSEYKCDLCYHGFRLKVTYENHMEKHKLIKGKVLCDICHKSVPKKRLTLHKTRFHSYNYHCGQCDHVDKNTTQAKKHYHWHQGFVYECKICGKRHNTATGLMGHMHYAHKDIMVNCSICGKRYNGERGLRFHMNLSHSEAVGAKCESCNLQFYSQDAMRRHSPQDDCDRNVRPCVGCGEGFVSDSLLRQHTSSCDSMKIHSCAHCCERFVSESLCKKHIYSHPPCRRLRKQWVARFHKYKVRKGIQETPTLPSLCEHCGKTFPTKVQYRQHLRSHTRKKTYICDYCGKGFFVKFHIEYHIQRDHMGINYVMRRAPKKKPSPGDPGLVCRVCEKRFSDRGNRLKHEKNIHIYGSQSFCCDFCGKVFKSNEGMKSHVKHTHEGVPWPKRQRTRQTERQSASKSPSKEADIGSIVFRGRPGDNTFARKRTPGSLKFEDLVTIVIPISP